MIRVVYGTVTNIDDPEKRGRIKATIPVWTTDFRSAPPQVREFPFWLDPVFPFAGNGFGYFFLPAIDSKIEIQAQSAPDGVMSDFKWRGCLYSLNDPIPEEFKTDYGKLMGFKTPNGVEFIVEADKIRLGAEAVEPLVLGTQFQILYNALVANFNKHVHITAGAIPGPTSKPDATAPGLPQWFPILAAALSSAELSKRSFTK